MPISRSTSRASSEGIIPSRAQLPTPPEHTRTRPAAPRAASMRSRRTWAITLRAVLAWQTTRTVSATRVGQGPVIRVTRGRPLPEHPPKFRPHGIDPAQRHRPATDREVVVREIAGAGEVPGRRLGAAVAGEPFTERELRAGLLIVVRGQTLQPADLGLGEGRRLAAHPRPE